MTLRLLKSIATIVALPSPGWHGPTEQGQQERSSLRDMIQQKFKQEMFAKPVSILTLILISDLLSMRKSTCMCRCSHVLQLCLRSPSNNAYIISNGFTVTVQMKQRKKTSKKPKVYLFKLCDRQKLKVDQSTKFHLIRFH